MSRSSTVTGRAASCLSLFCIIFAACRSHHGLELREGDVMITMQDWAQTVLANLLNFTPSKLHREVRVLTSRGPVGATMDLPAEAPVAFRSL